MQLDFLKKGSQAAENGRISTRHYENEKGDRVYDTEVVTDFVQYLDPKPHGQVNLQGQGYQQPQGQGSYRQQPNRSACNMSTQNQSTSQYGAGRDSIVVSDKDLPL